MPMHGIEIQLDRARNVYHQGEHLSGRLVLDNKYELRHEGLQISLEGFVDVSTNYTKRSSTSLLLDSLNGSAMRTLPLVDVAHDLLEPGRLPPGKTTVPFKILLDGSLDAPSLYETYHGVYVTIQYFVKCRLRRPLFFRDLLESREIVLEYDPRPIGAPEHTPRPLAFEITPERLMSATAAAAVGLIPNFKITGQLDSAVWLLDEPITGHFIIEACQAPIRSIELQLVRVETVGGPAGLPEAALEDARPHGGQKLQGLPPPLLGSRLAGQGQGLEGLEFSRDATEVQNIQIGDGDLMRRVPISIYMVLPRLFTCPTLLTGTFRVQFELNLVIIFADNHLLSENFPIKLIRSTLQPISS